MALLHLVTLLVLQSGFGFDQQMRQTMIQVSAGGDAHTYTAGGASKPVVKDPNPATESLVAAAAHTSKKTMRSKLISQQDEEEEEEEEAEAEAGDNRGEGEEMPCRDRGNVGWKVGGRRSHKADCCFSESNIYNNKGYHKKHHITRNFDVYKIDGVDEKGRKVEDPWKKERGWLDDKGPYDYKRDSRLCFRVNGGCKSAMDLLNNTQKRDEWGGWSADPRNCGMLKRIGQTKVIRVPGGKGDCREPEWSCGTVVDVKEKLCQGFSDKCEWCKKSRKGVFDKDTLETKAEWKSKWDKKTISEDAYFEKYCEMCTFHARKCKNDNQSESN